MRNVVPVVLVSLVASVVACSSSSEGEPAPSRAKPSNPTAGYAQTTPIPTGTTSSLDAGAAPVDAARASADAGLRKADGGKPVLPPANLACRDLGNCCQKIKSTLERSACIGVASLAKPSTCATALIGYQIVGCGHSPFSLGSPGSHDRDGNGNPDWVDPQGDPDVSLEDYCASYPEDVDTCAGGVTGYDEDPCIANPNAYECLDDPFAGDPDFSDPSDPGDPGDPFDPFGPGDPDDGDPDPFDPFGD